MTNSTQIKYRVEFYEKENGTAPARDFLLSLDARQLAKMAHIIELLQNNGPELREPYSKHLIDGIFELRARFGTDSNRVLYFFYEGGLIILTNGFVKKTQKTPKREIEKAKNYRKDYLSRKEQAK